MPSHMHIIIILYNACFYKYQYIWHQTMPSLYVIKWILCPFYKNVGMIEYSMA